MKLLISDKQLRLYSLNEEALFKKINYFDNTLKCMSFEELQKKIGVKCLRSFAMSLWLYYCSFQWIGRDGTIDNIETKRFRRIVYGKECQKIYEDVKYVLCVGRIASVLHMNENCGEFIMLLWGQKFIQGWQSVC